MTKLLIAIILCLPVCFARAQDTVYLKKESNLKTITDREPQAVFVELFGPGLFSINYDRRFKKQTEGWGYRGGLGYINSSGDYSVVTVPVGINYLAGKKGRFFELGLNESLFFVKVNPINLYYSDALYGVNLDESKTIAVTTATIGYRSQPTNGGFCFRVGLLPYTTFSGPPNLSIYISFGYNF